MNKKIYDFWEKNPQLSNEEKAAQMNAIFGKTWVPRTYQQRYSNYKQGIEEDMRLKTEEASLERIAKAELNLEIKRKQNVIKKYTLNKLLNGVAMMDIVKEDWANHKVAAMPERVKIAPKEGEVMVEYTFSDFHYDGHDESKEIIFKARDLVLDDMEKENVKYDKLRFVDLGDSIEGTSAHKSQLLQVKVGAVPQIKEYGEYMHRVINQMNKAKRKGSKMDVVSVISANHSTTRPFNTRPSEFPTEDLASLLHWHYKYALDKDIYLWDGNEDGGILTDELTPSLYFHGHEGWNRGKKDLVWHSGHGVNFKHGHFHTDKLTAIGPYTMVLGYGMGMAKARDYAKNAGYKHLITINKTISIDGVVQSRHFIRL